MSASPGFFRHSTLDSIPALCGVGIVGLLLSSLANFDAWPTWGLALAFYTVMGYSVTRPLTLLSIRRSEAS